MSLGLRVLGCVSAFVAIGYVRGRAVCVEDDMGRYRIPTSLQAPPPTFPDAGPEVKTASGLRYVDLKQGDPSKPAIVHRFAMIHYECWLPDGTKIDSSFARKKPFVFPLGRRQVIMGWDEGIATMHEGGLRRLIVPPHLAFGEAGKAPRVPPNTTLTFDVLLLGHLRGSAYMYFQREALSAVRFRFNQLIRTVRGWLGLTNDDLEELQLHPPPRPLPSLSSFNQTARVPRPSQQKQQQKNNNNNNSNFYDYQSETQEEADARMKWERRWVKEQRDQTLDSSTSKPQHKKKDTPKILITRPSASAASTTSTSPSPEECASTASTTSTPPQVPAPTSPQEDQSSSTPKD
eukprot:gnl/Spiro4/28680_TR14190_c0_g1_i1.p1 gnl/Spiro4/28680_TR14190_c0_g1~~gnl/Spiro4/28680_TR14190_c0_g1_i1.p1  ORF type:complete len:347 (+),score=71.34 gnl/Spiro4/28680_TR14190_c0_g1_i1:42-1082(+)